MSRQLPTPPKKQPPTGYARNVAYKAGAKNRRNAWRLCRKTSYGEAVLYPEFFPASYEQTGRIKERFKAKYDWELDGKFGDRVIILTNPFPEWCFCYNESTGKMGIIPRMYLKITEPEIYVTAAMSSSRHNNDVSGSPNRSNNSEVTAPTDQPTFSESSSYDVPSPIVKPKIEVPSRPATYENLRKPKPSAIWFCVDFKYTSTEDATILSVEEGDLLRLDDSTEKKLRDSAISPKEEWLQCTNLKGETGFFPSTYGHIIYKQDELIDRLKDIPHGVVESPYYSRNPKEMSVEVGDVVYLTSEEDHFYSGFKADGSIGYIPDHILNIIHPL